MGQLFAKIAFLPSHATDTKIKVPFRNLGDMYRPIRRTISCLLLMMKTAQLQLNMVC